MSSYIEDLTDNRTLPKTFLSIQWDNEGFEYDQLSDEDFDKLPSVVVIDEKKSKLTIKSQLNPKKSYLF